MATGWAAPVPRPTYAPLVAEKVWTADELERLSPTERDALFESSVATSLDPVPSTFLDRVRERIVHRIADTNTNDA